MIPEIEITCSGRRFFTNTVTVEQYKRYISIMERNDASRRRDAMFLNKKIIQELFENQMSLAEMGTAPAIEFLTAIKAVHFIMQNVIAEKILNIVEAEPIEREASAFDEYDIENGYEEEQQEENQWKICGEIIDRIIKIAIRLLKNSYSQCMSEDIISLLNYLKFELNTINENQ